MTEQDMGLVFGLGMICGVALAAFVSFITDLLS